MFRNVYLYHPKKKSYVMIQSDGSMAETSDRTKAHIFREDKAVNVLRSHARSRFFRGYHLLPVAPPPSVPQPASAGCADTLDGLDAAFRAAQEALCKCLREKDLEISDLCHYAENHPALPAHAGYKIYKHLAVLRTERRAIKYKLEAVSQCLNPPDCYIYSPRTPLYERLEEICTHEPDRKERKTSDRH